MAGLPTTAEMVDALDAIAVHVVDAYVNNDPEGAIENIVEELGKVNR